MNLTNTSKHLWWERDTRRGMAEQNKERPVVKQMKAFI